MHCPADIFAPYKTGNVVVPTTKATVIESASGAGSVIPYANSLGINNKINSKNYTDPISVRAMASSGDVKNLFAFRTNFPAESSPWEWWDRQIVQGINFPSPGAGRNADSLSFLTNPFMSAARAKAYIDTIAQFVAPRIAAQFDLEVGTSVNNINYSYLLGVYPNPAKENVTISMDKNQANISQVVIFDITGKVVYTNNSFSAHEVNVNTENLTNGIYLVNVTLANGVSTTKRLSIQ
jgi:hypothetical protein